MGVYSCWERGAGLYTLYERDDGHAKGARRRLFVIPFCPRIRGYMLTDWTNSNLLFVFSVLLRTRALSVCREDMRSRCGTVSNTYSESERTTSCLLLRCVSPDECGLWVPGHSPFQFQMSVLVGLQDLGWVVGHSYILYAPLLIGAATVIFEGKPILPDAGILWRTCSTLGVNALFTAPTALRAVRANDPDAKYMRNPQVDLRKLRTLFLAGERSEPQIVSAYAELLKELAAPGASVNDNVSVLNEAERRDELWSVLTPFAKKKTFALCSDG